MSKKLVPNTNLSESVRKDLRAATLALGVIRATKEGFEVDTSVVNGTSATQGDGAGALSTGVNDGQVNQSSRISLPMVASSISPRLIISGPSVAASAL